MNSHFIEADEADGVLVLTIVPSELRERDVCYATRDQMLAAVKEASVGKIVFDMKNLRFVGSVGLLGFLAVRRAVPHARLIVCNMEDTIRDMLLLCRLLTASEAEQSPFDSCGTLEEAKRELEG